MITTDAFNALLKTLEEPPPQTVFIFATTEFHKVPATIVSRCQHFEFKRVSQREIVDHLTLDRRQEKGSPSSDYGLTLIAEASDGSIRDAQSLLDQAVAFCGEDVGDDDLKEILGVIGRDLLFGFSSRSSARSRRRSSRSIEKVVERGPRPARLLQRPHPALPQPAAGAVGLEARRTSCRPAPRSSPPSKSRSRQGHRGGAAALSPGPPGGRGRASRYSPIPRSTSKHSWSSSASSGRSFPSRS